MIPMKLYALFGFIASLPFSLRAAFVAQATAHASLNAWELGKDISFAGLVWFLIGYALPKLMDGHRVERDALVKMMDGHQSENRTLLDSIAKQHAESTKSGHEAAASLAGEIRSLKEQIER